MVTIRIRGRSRPLHEGISSFFGIALVLLPFIGSVQAGEDADENADGAKGERKAAKDADLAVRGTLGRSVSGADGFYEIQFSTRDEKGRAKKTTAFLFLPEASEEEKDDGDLGTGGDERARGARGEKESSRRLEILYDRRLRSPTELEPGTKVAIFGKPIVHDVPGRGGGLILSGKDYQIQNAQVILAGNLDTFGIDRAVTVDKLPGYKWCFGEVNEDKGGLSVDFEGQSYRVTLAKAGPILSREALDREKLRKGASIDVVAAKTEHRPPSHRAADHDRPAFEAKRIVVLDRRLLRTIYPLIAREED